MIGRDKKNKMKIEIENNQRNEMRHILVTARRIINQSSEYDETHPIFLLIKQLVDQELYDNIYRSISTHDSNRVKTYDIYDMIPNRTESQSFLTKFMDEKSDDKYLYINEATEKKVSYRDFFNSTRLEGKTATIKLGYDPVLTRPWAIDRLVGAYANIGKGKLNGEWLQDQNHSVELWLPFGISFVHNGNHSITTGILMNEGVLQVSDIYDLSGIYPHLYCDGVNFFRTKDNSYYSPVRNFKLSVVFEIGRLIQKHRIKRIA